MGCTPYCTPLLLGIRGRMKIHLHELMYLIGRIYFTIKKQLSKKLPMKKLHLLLLTGSMLLSQIVCGQITSPSPYCAAGYDDMGGTFAVDHHISNVTLGTLNNTTGSTQYTGAHYAYYNTVTAPNLTKGSSYPLSVTHDGGTTIHFLAVYIDFNHNNDFSDAGERVLQYTINGPSIPNPATATVAIPATAATGVTRMRVMVFEDDNYTWTLASTNATPCTADATGTFDWGETEDYNVNLVAATASCDTVTGLTLSAITGSSAHMAWTAVTGSAGYQYIVNTTAASPTTSGTNTTATSANATGLLAGTVYYAHVRDSCGVGSFSAWVNKQFTTSVGVNDVTLQNAATLSVHPNPVSNLLTINVDGNAGSTGVADIVDVTGRLLLHTDINGNTQLIDVSTLQSGVYLLRYNDGINTSVVRFVKQ